MQRRTRKSIKKKVDVTGEVAPLHPCLLQLEGGKVKRSWLTGNMYFPIQGKMLNEGGGWLRAKQDLNNGLAGAGGRDTHFIRRPKRANAKKKNRGSRCVN